jgi:hypothetical protein
VTPLDNGSLFRVVVSNIAGSVTSGQRNLIVEGPPVITAQPQDKSVNAGKTATFNVAATGSKTLTYQWRKNGTNISGATLATYTTPATTALDNGSLFSAVVTSPYGTVTSRDALLTVNSH